MIRLFLATTGLLLASCSNAASPPNLVAKLEAMADAGNAEALYHLGMAYQTGTGATLDTRKAFNYFERAAATGDPLAAYKVGCVWDGQGALVTPDEDKALRYKLIAAKAGYALAQQDVAGLLYRQGRKPEAMSWLERAARQGTEDALMAYASANNSDDFARNPAITAAYFRIVLNRSGASDEQAVWLSNFEAKLDTKQKAEAARLVADYRPQPTPLTMKALSGLAAAEALVRSGASQK